MITIDGVAYDVKIKVISRKVETLYKFAERTEDGVLHSELIGVYFNYDLEVGKSSNNKVAYAALWQKITEPVASHQITMPDESGDVTFSAYFANIKDEVAKTGSTNYFHNLSFSVVAISPART